MIFSGEDNVGNQRTKLVLEKYVRRNHSPEKIIGDKSFGVITRSKLKESTCLISKIELRIVKAMNEEIG
jgi:hypothetical protein